MDPGGAVVPGASVEAIAVDTKVTRTVETGSSGAYVLTLLPPGNYQVVISKAGFQPLTENDIKLDVNQTISINPTLSVGTASISVEVQASSQLIDSSTSELGTVIGERPVHDLPLNGRNFTQLLTLVPGATPISTSQGHYQGTDDGSTVAIPGSAFSNPSINGQQNRESLYLLDGVVNTDFRTTTYTVLPIVDGVSEFKVQSHNDDPSFGFVLGGVVNIISKSGTNQFHGSAWEFIRNNDFDARNSFTDFNGDGTPRAAAPFHQNEFGGVIGGPVRIPHLYDGRDKTFFFFGYEGWRYSQPQNSLYVVPTPAEVGGDFSNAGYGANAAIFDPSTTTVNASGNGYTRQQFANNVIPQGQIDPQIQTYIKTYFDQPNLAGNPNYNEILRQPLVDNSNNYQGRIDQTLTKKDTIFFRWSNQFVINNNPDTNTVTSLSDFGGLNIGAGITHVFSPKLLLNVNGGRASRAFTFSNQSSTSLAELTTLGFPGLSTYGPVGINLSGPYGSSSLASPALRRNSAWSVGSQLSWLVGAHTLTFGASVIDQYRSQHGNGQSFNFNNQQTADPNNLGTTGNSLASALLGYPSQGNFQSSNTIKYSIPTYAVFGGDSWKISPKLTLNLGLRFDHIDQPDFTSGMNNGFDFDTGNWEIGGGKLPAACATSNKAPCIPGPSTDATADLANIVGYDGSIAGSHIIVAASASRAPKPDFMNFGPRFGFAYTFTPETVVRGGFGIVYDTLNSLSQTLSNSVGEWPAKSSTSPTYNLTGAPLTSVSDAESNIGSPLPAASPFQDFDYYYSPKEKPLYSEQYNLQVEQTISKETVFTLGYVGSVSKRLDYAGTANAATTPGAGTVAQVNARRPYAYMTTFVYDSTIANGNYNSLQAKLERRFVNGTQFLVSYTWSKSMDQGTSGHYGAENGIGNAVQNYYSPKSNYSVSGYDVTNFVSVSGVYELPAGKGKRFFHAGPLSYALGGWQLNTVAQLRSGQPYTISVDGDIANIGISGGGYGRPNVVGSTQVSHPTYRQAFNTSAFSVPVLSYGDVSRNSMRSQPYYSDDLSLFKAFAFTETARLEFRAEAFNVFNIINYDVPGYDLSNPSTFGVISSITGLPRQLQFALKLSF
jgi:hypothetical protein